METKSVLINNVPIDTVKKWQKLRRKIFIQRDENVTAPEVFAEMVDMMYADIENQDSDAEEEAAF